MDLESMKYAELRALAKELGVKANMKGDKLLKAIKQHYQEKNEDEVQNHADAAEQQGDISASHDAAQNHEDAAGKEVHSPVVFVNTRRGKQRGVKRKMSEPSAAIQCDAELPAQGDAAAACSPKGSKKGQVNETEPPVTSSEQQPVVKHHELSWGDAGNEPKGGKIPRYERLQKKTALKPVTPNFKKLHEAHFNKMESIDSYVQRKNKQMETYRNAVKELKVLSDKTKLQADGKVPPASQSHPSMFSPVPVNKNGAADTRRNTVLSTSKLPVKKPAGKEDGSFRPSVISTRRINVRFSEATNDNEYKRSVVKTPARMSLRVASDTPQKQTSAGGKALALNTSTLSVTKTPGPFIFTANSSTSATPGTQKKPAFDLKASLSRPLNYRPHTGKLRPFGEMKVNTAGNDSVISHSQQNYKQHRVQTREEKRAKCIEGRKQKKESLLGARRGLVMM